MSKKTSFYIKQIIKEFGQELKRVREEKNLNYQEAAELAGFYNPQLIERLEKGKKNLRFKFIRLARAYKQKICIHLENAEEMFND